MHPIQGSSNTNNILYNSRTDIGHSLVPSKLGRTALDKASIKLFFALFT